MCAPLTCNVQHTGEIMTDTKNWSGPRKRLTALGVLVLLSAAAFTGWTAWRKVTYRSTHADVLNVTRHVTLTPERQVSYDATLQYADSSGCMITQTTAFRASWLKFDKGERVPILVNPRNASDFVFNAFLPTWGFCLLLSGAGGVILLIGRAL